MVVIIIAFFISIRECILHYKLIFNVSNTKKAENKITNIYIVTYCDIEIIISMH